MPLQIIRQDITKMAVDAIVNTTNRDMVGYSGVDFAVHHAAGQELDAQCERLEPLEKGTVSVTDGYLLNCKYIIHTRGPTWMGGERNEKELLESCYTSCLNAAFEHGCETIAFPLISSGAYGFPKDRVLKIAVDVITGFLFAHEMTVYICVFDRESYEFSQRLFSDISDYISDEYVEQADEAFNECCCQPYEETRRKGIRPDESFSQNSVADFSPDEEPVLISPMYGGDYSVPSPPRKKSESLDDWLKSMDKGFAETLFGYIDKRGIADVECYKKANVDKKTFSKIKCNSGYRPSKQTVLAFAIALELSLEDTNHLLQTVGMSLSHSNKFDVIIEYFIVNGKYNIFEINEALFEFDQILLGC